MEWKKHLSQETRSESRLCLVAPVGLLDKPLPLSKPVFSAVKEGAGSGEISGLFCSNNL